MSRIRLVLQTVQTDQPQEHAFGARYLYKVGKVSHITTDLVCDFDLKDGDHKASVVALDGDCQPMGDTVTFSFTTPGEITAEAASHTMPAPSSTATTYPAPASLQVHHLT